MSLVYIMVRYDKRVERFRLRVGHYLGHVPCDVIHNKTFVAVCNIIVTYNRCLTKDPNTSLFPTFDIDR